MSTRESKAPLTPDAVFSALAALHREQQAASLSPSPSPPSSPLLRLLDELGVGPPAAARAADDGPEDPPSADVIDLSTRQPSRGADVPPADGETPQTVFARLRGMLDEYDELVRRYHADFDELHDRHAPAGAVAETDDEQLLERMRQGQRILLKYPIAAQAALAALVAEGRRYAETPEGLRWKQTLVDSPLVRRGRAVWEATALRSFESPAPGQPARALPGGFVEAFLRASARTDLEPLLARLFAGRDEVGDAG